MLNYETLLSSYDDKLTLMQWLKKVEAALKDASAVSFKVNKRGDATLTFSVVFEDGSELETGPITLQQGESVQAATIRNGHLILTLTNGDELDAGDLGAVSGFSINASQHLIVTYQNGSTQDLGAIFSGNVVISGNFEVTGLAKLPSIEGDENGNINVDADITISDGNLTIDDGAVSTPILTSASDHIEAQKPVIEVMGGYYFSISPYLPPQITLDLKYVSACKNGNKLTLVIFGTIKRTAQVQSGWGTIGNFQIPDSIAALIYPYQLGNDNVASNGAVVVSKDIYSSDDKSLSYAFIKNSHFLQLYIPAQSLNTLTLDETYAIRIENTFLFSANLID